MLDEARRARGRTIYLVFLTDTKWNVSFQTGTSGEEEVADVLEAARKDLGRKLHVTLFSSAPMVPLPSCGFQ